MASIEDYTPEEKQRKLISKLVNLPKRQAVVKVRGEPYDAVPFISADLPVKKQEVLKADFEKTLQEANRRNAKPALEVDRLIETRRGFLLGQITEAPGVSKLLGTEYNDAKPDEPNFDQDSYEPKSR